MPTMTSVAAAVLAVAVGLGGSAVIAAPIRAASPVNFGPQSSGTYPVNVAVTVEHRERIFFSVSVDTPVLIIGYFNWSLNPSSGVANPGNSHVINLAAVEYNGTSTPITFSASRSVTMTQGLNILADEIPASAFSLTKFAAGTSGFIRTKRTLSNPATDKLPQIGGFRGTGSSGYYMDPTKVIMTNDVDSTGIYTYTMTNGGVNGTDAKTANFGIGCFVLGRHNSTAFGIWGDSKTAGTGDSPTAVAAAGVSRCLFSNPASSTGTRPGINFGNPSGIAADCTTAVGGATVSQLTYWYQFLTYGLVGYGTNALTQATQTSLHAQIRANGIASIIQYSLTPRTSSTVSLSSLTSVGTTCTGVMADTSGLQTGQSYPITGATPAAYNGSFAITVVDGTSFTYTAGSAPGSAATGTLLIDDRQRTTKYQTLNGAWGVGSAADLFQQFLFNKVAGDAFYAYYEDLGERSSPTPGTAGYWLWKVNGAPFSETGDGLHQTALGYEDSYGTAGNYTTQAGGTISSSMRAIVQALP